MSAMSGSGRSIVPAGGAVARYHDAKHEVFLHMYDDFIAFRRIMGNWRDVARGGFKPRSPCGESRR